MGERHLTVAEVAERLRTSRWTISRRLKEHPEIRPIKTGRSVVFDRAAVRALEEALRCPSASTPPEPERETDSGSPESRSMDDALRSARAQQTRRLLADGRANSSAASAKIVLLDQARR
jgi:excisionase family DNA binding protein